jgi:hypothetical protein
MGMLRAKGCRETDATRRAALQIALQLPEQIDEARAVLDRASYLLENFLIVPTAPLASIAAPRPVKSVGGERPASAEAPLQD